MDVTSTGGGDASSAPVETSVAETQTQEQTTEQKTPQSLKEKFKYTIDGEDVEEEVDLSDKESLRKRLQLAHAANKRMSEAKGVKAKAFEIIKAFEEDPANVFRKLGPKGREAAERFLLEQINDEMLTDDEKKARADKLELENYRKEREKKKAEEEKAETSAKEAKLVQDYQATIIEALEKCGLPKNQMLAIRMAKLMKDNLDHGLDLDANDLAQLVKSERVNDQKAILKDMTGQQIIEYFGEEVANKIRKADLEKLRSKQSEIFQSGGGSNSSKEASSPKERGPMSMDEWKESVNRRINGK